MEAVIAQRISWAVEEHELLPRNHLGGRRGISTEHALRAMVERIQDAKRKGCYATLLSMDVSGAYDNVSHPRLLHNLRKRRIGGTLCRWISSFIAKRTTVIRLPEVTSPSRGVDTGIPQGSPISPILYLFYNADLIESNDNTEAFGWVDDVAYLTVGQSMEDNCRELEEVYRQRSAPWARRHASIFDVKKFQMMHFWMKPSNANLEQPSIRLGEIDIPPQEALKYLGLIFDSNLAWKHHLSEVEGKATKRLAVLNSLAKSTWGLNVEELRIVYRGTILPQFLYCASVWYSPAKPNRNGAERRTAIQKAAEKKLAAIQRRAAKTIAGAFRTVSGPALDIELFLLPAHIQLRQAIEMSHVQIATSQTKDIIKAYRTTEPNASHRDASPLQRLEAEFDKGQYRLGELEVRAPYITPPWWVPPGSTILSSKDEARTHHNRILLEDPGALILYTDGTGIDGKVAAAAINPFMAQERAVYLGPEESFNVYSAELYGILMAIEMAIEDGRKSCHIFTDNQAAITSSCAPLRQSGQYILRKIVEAMNTHRTKSHLHLHWVPAHIGIPGNELADLAAKEATGWRQNGERQAPAPTPPDLYLLASAVKADIRREKQGRWAREWNEENVRAAETRRLAPMPTKKTLANYSKTNRAESSALIQLRTGHIGLNGFLNRINAADTEECSCRGQPRQTPRHIVTICPRFAELRETMLKGVCITDWDRLLNDPAQAAKAAAFIIRTGLLGQFRHVLAELRAEEEEARDQAGNPRDTP